jgi:hypothetical protein
LDQALLIFPFLETATDVSGKMTTIMTGLYLNIHLKHKKLDHDAFSLQ